MEKSRHIKKENVASYSIEENSHSGLELELHFMPRFFHENGCGTMAPHIHEFYQIIWFRHGQGTHRIDFVDYPVTDNTIFFVAPGQIHAFDGMENYEGVIILFNANFLANEESSENIFLKYNVFNAYDSLPYYKVSNEEAERLLQHTSLNIKEIGYNLGFEDPSYFVKFFKRLAGSMPSEFRKRK